ncbi:MAG: crossover junction endodeoxyribonuclease RuvC [Oligoflexia bacterium]|nr:crossover junction endodeoxyribonuclease RuvC [Oligoflexia bacterium]
MIRIMGIDPGTLKVGYSFLEIDKESGRQIKYIQSGVLTFSKYRNFDERIHAIFLLIKNLVIEYAPDEVAMESLIYVKNPLTLIKLGHARGAIVAAVLEAKKLQLFEYLPSVVKKIATGYGMSSKEFVFALMGKERGNSSFSSFDESDAQAIAMCHVLLRKSQQTLCEKACGEQKTPSKTVASYLGRKPARKQRTGDIMKIVRTTR